MGANKFPENCQFESNADLIRALQRAFPHVQIRTDSNRGAPPGGSSSSSSISVRGFTYVDELALSSTDPVELQAMITFAQRWSEFSRLLINDDKTKIMAFHENKKHRELRARQQPSFFLCSSFPFASQVQLKVVEEFKYLGLYRPGL